MPQKSVVYHTLTTSSTLSSMLSVCRSSSNYTSNHKWLWNQYKYQSVSESLWVMSTDSGISVLIQQSESTKVH